VIVRNHLGVKCAVAKRSLPDGAMSNPPTRALGTARHPSTDRRDSETLMAGVSQNDQIRAGAHLWARVSQGEGRKKERRNEGRRDG